MKVVTDRPQAIILIENSAARIAKMTYPITQKLAARGVRLIMKEDSANRIRGHQLSVLNRKPMQRTIHVRS